MGEQNKFAVFNTANFCSPMICTGIEGSWFHVADGWAERGGDRWAPRPAGNLDFWDGGVKCLQKLFRNFWKTFKKLLKNFQKNFWKTFKKTLGKYRKINFLCYTSEKWNFFKNDIFFVHFFWKKKHFFFSFFSKKFTVFKVSEKFFFPFLPPRLGHPIGVGRRRRIIHGIGLEAIGIRWCWQSHWVVRSGTRGIRTRLCLFCGRRKGQLTIWLSVYWGIQIFLKLHLQRLMI